MAPIIHPGMKSSKSPLLCESTRQRNMSFQGSMGTRVGPPKVQWGCQGAFQKDSDGKGEWGGAGRLMAWESRGSIRPRCLDSCAAAGPALGGHWR